MRRTPVPGACSPARLAMLVAWTCLCSSVSAPSFPSHGSVQQLPRFPRTGPAVLGSPPSVRTSKALRLPALLPCGLLLRQPLPRLPVASCSPQRSPAVQACCESRGLVVAGHPIATIPTWTGQDLPGSLASHPAALPTLLDPGRPGAPRPWRRFRCGPQCLHAAGTDIDDLEAR